ncbi:hypothetical protein BCR43DRAFT_485900 [Syncephalastrum racemosum]|uniref:Uncharacterized protein n=1 Tax=Syncephalastrum racemosum TaxID=13706 RepID=A0A1X2HNC4_SYNRA|nr:hypothetical protein BCR43DRAFT_485900 [Syncephalastrum racemosum]
MGVAGSLLRAAPYLDYPLQFHFSPPPPPTLSVSLRLSLSLFSLFLFTSFSSFSFSFYTYLFYFLPKEPLLSFLGVNPEHQSRFLFHFLLLGLFLSHWRRFYPYYRAPRNPIIRRSLLWISSF